MSERVEGKVKWFDKKKGFGFILWKKDDKTYDVFVHYSYIDQDGYKELEENQVVSFVVEDSLKGLQAKEVRMVE